MGLRSFLHHSDFEILRRIIEVDTASSSIPDFSKDEFLALMKISMIIERQARGLGLVGLSLSQTASKLYCNKL